MARPNMPRLYHLNWQPAPILARLTLSASLMSSLGLAIAATSSGALAQSADGTSAQLRHYQIPAGPLSQVLSRYASEAGVELVAAASLMQGKMSAGLSGDYSVTTGFSALLADHGLVATRAPSGVYTLHTITLPTATELPAVTVVANSEENPTAPIVGYVARTNLTGTKTNTLTREIPQSISVITRDQIDDQGAAPVLQDALRYTPGLIGTRGVNLTDDSFNMRGFAAGLATTSNTPVFRDGLRQSPAMYASTVEPYGAERIEVLRGPASVLFGQVTPGGLINVTSKLPTQEPLREIDLQVGTRDHKQLGLDLGGPIDEEGAWSYRLTAMARDAKTQTDYIPNDRQYLAAALKWQPAAHTSLTLLASYQHTSTMYNWGLPVSGSLLGNPNGKLPRDRFTGEPDFDDYDTKTRTLGYQFEHRFNDTWTFRQNARYYKSDMKWDSAYGASMQADQRTLSRFGFIRADDYESYAVDTQLQAKWQHGIFEHTTLAGVDYSYTPWVRNETRGTVAPLDLYDPVYGSPVTPNARPSRILNTHARQLGLYLQEQVKIDGRWVLMAGVRHDRSSSDINGVLTNGSANSPEAPVHIKSDASATTGRAGVVYLFDNGWSPYASVATSFEPESGALDYNNRPFEPTKGVQFEVGAKYEPQDRPFSFNAAVYDLRRDNVLTADPEHPGYSVQTGRIRSRGLELEVRGDITPQLQVIGAYTYTHAKIDRSNSGDQGTSPPGVPRHVLALWGVYRFGENVLPGFKVGMGARYIAGTSGYVLGNTPTPARLPSYVVADAMASYTRGPWTVSLHVNNLFDRDYIQSCYYATTTCYYGDGRSAIARASYRW